MDNYLDSASDVKAARPSADALASSLFALIDAKVELDKAIAKVPSYTGQFESADYYATEQEAYNRAAESYEDAVRASLVTTPHIDPLTGQSTT